MTTRVWAFACAAVLGCAGEAATLASAGSGGQAALSNVGGGGASGASGSVDMAGGAGATSDVVLGEEIELVAGVGEVPYVLASNPYAIRGSAFLRRSELGNDVRVAEAPGELCIAGEIEDIPNQDYARYWGIELGFELALDALGAAEAEPWQPGQVIGFSYVIEGPRLSPIRFKALPAGYDPELDTSVFCKDLEVQSGAAEQSLFRDVTRACWEPGNGSVPLADGLVRISWLLAADLEPVDRHFDWCLKELRPILAAP